MMVTPLYASLLALWLLLLSVRVSQLRMEKHVMLGDGEDHALRRVIRGHANFTEYVPLALVLLVLLEVSRFSVYVLHLLGGLLLLGRVLHGYALCYTPEWRFGRFWGTILTLLVLVLAALLCLYQAGRGHLAWFAPDLG